MGHLRRAPSAILLLVADPTSGQPNAALARAYLDLLQQALAQNGKAGVTLPRILRLIADLCLFVFGIATFSSEGRLGWLGAAAFIVGALLFFKDGTELMVEDADLVADRQVIRQAIAELRRALP